MSLIKSAKKINIYKAAQALKNGALIGFPTETVYGLAADAENETAVNRIFAVKNRPTDHPLIIHIESIDYLDYWAINIQNYVWTIAQEFWPGPLTLILNRSSLVADFVTGKQDSVALRIPDHDVALKLLREFTDLGGKGLAAPSANKFQAVSPTNAEEVLLELGEDLNKYTDFILDGGKCRVGIESTILDCRNESPEVLRSGIITSEAIEDIAKIKMTKIKKNKDLRFPGSHLIHYSPKAKILLEDRKIDGSGFIALSDVVTPPGYIRLAAPEDLETFARDLYSAFRLGDKLNLKVITVIPPSEKGLGQAILDRISRASSKH